MAERPGYNPDTALTLDHAIADPSNALLPKGAIEVELLGRRIPAVEMPGGLRALVEKVLCTPTLARQYLKNIFGDALDEVRGGMERRAITAALIALFVAGLSGYDHLLWIAGFILFYRIVQDYVLYPYLMGDRSRVPPVMIIFGLLAGEELGGVAGVMAAFRQALRAVERPELAGRRH